MTRAIWFWPSFRGEMAKQKRKTEGLKRTAGRDGWELVQMVQPLQGYPPGFRGVWSHFWSVARGRPIAYRESRVILSFWWKGTPDSQLNTTLTQIEAVGPAPASVSSGDVEIRQRGSRQ